MTRPSADEFAIHAFNAAARVPGHQRESRTTPSNGGWSSRGMDEPSVWAKARNARYASDCVALSRSGPQMISCTIGRAPGAASDGSAEGGHCQMSISRARKRRFAKSCR